MKIDCNIKLENILTANISATQKYWILQGLNRMTNEDSHEEAVLTAIIRNLHYAIEAEKHK